MRYVALFLAAAVAVIVIAYTFDEARVAMNAAVDRAVELVERGLEALRNP